MLNIYYSKPMSKQNIRIVIKWLKNFLIKYAVCKLLSIEQESRPLSGLR